ncbi:hypothetical protein [Peterkaempfera bronchialis]|uniref:hypothetical protein n=1 Tax=Peterkaempfera bronchialis TaxID=2126346 RepID=UPI0013B36ABC|nr:hypothetical protein [Peterkaempfera bronchialis]
MRAIHRTAGARRLLLAAGVLLLAAVPLTIRHPAAAGTVSAASARPAPPGPRTADASPRMPPAPSGIGAAVLAPITAGLVLTGIAAYRRRGLPGGH